MVKVTATLTLASSPSGTVVDEMAPLTRASAIETDIGGYIIMIVAPERVTLDPRPHFQPAVGAGARTRKLSEIEQALGNMSIRITAVHAHEQSLQRAAQGLQTIGQKLEVLLAERVSRHGWSIDQQLAHSAFLAMQHQLQLVREAERPMPVEQLRAHLKHAMFRAIDMVVLLEV